MPNIFPLTLDPVERGSFPHSPPLAKKLWIGRDRTIAPGLTWYAVGLEVHGPDNVIVRVYDIRDNFHGGIGERIFHFSPKLSAKHKAELALHIHERQLAYAADEFKRLEQARREQQIEALRAELFDGASS